ncbi:MAG: DUF2147 domain-containing protein [Methyloceanibacter sp.]|nr:DUF2147 domain-containing protein [Methyloceanibacter sp.]
MRHHVFSAAIAIALVAVLAPVSATSAQAGNPTGYWRKADQGQHPAKMQLYRCGGRGICVKIVWLKNPRDSKGRELQDVRNANPKLRGRKIEGMHIIRGMKQVSGNQWKGTVYNPEDGKTYSATVTLASSRKIVLKGCVASFLCREQVWLRTSAPPPREEEKKPEPQVEASAEPGTAPVAAAPAAPAAVVPAAPKTAAPAPKAATAAAASTGLTIGSIADAEVQAPAAGQSGPPGLSYVEGSKKNQHPVGYSGESVSSMFSMATPLAPAAAPRAATPAPAAVRPAPVAAPAAPAPTPPPVSRQASVQPEAVRPEPAASEAQPAAPPEAVDDAVAAPAEAEPLTAEPPAAGQRLTWRERRQLRRQKRLKDLQQQGQNLIPWMRQQ